MFTAQNPYPCCPVYFLHPLMWNLFISLIDFISGIYCIEFTKVWVFIFSVSVLALSLWCCTSCSLLITLSDGRVGRQHGLGGRRHLFIEHSLNTHNSIKCVSYFKMRALLCYFSKMRTLLFSSFYSGGNKSWFFFLFLFLKLCVCGCVWLCVRRHRDRT